MVALAPPDAGPPKPRDWCVFCNRAHVVPAVGTYTDETGYVYPLCAKHLEGMARFSWILLQRERKRRAGTLIPADFRPIRWAHADDEGAPGGAAGGAGEA